VQEWKLTSEILK